ncbi:MAG: isopentenyl-diphosphate Delta-isomerase [Chitinophagaceae bacterium]
MSELILVNEFDEEIGTMEKMEVHRKGLLHRAFSVFIFDRQGNMLLQQRAISKYHNGGAWSNTCCSHPFPGESTESAALRRLEEEMGFSVPLVKLFDFVYKVDFSNGLTEHEFDHVFIGNYDGDVNYNPSEVMDYSFRNMHDIRSSLDENPGQFTEWFRITFPKLEDYWKSTFNS